MAKKKTPTTPSKAPETPVSQTAEAPAVAPRKRGRPPKAATATATAAPKAPMPSRPAALVVNTQRAANNAAMLLKQAADPTRLQVLLLLAERERHVGALCADLGHISQPACSHHLALLRYSRLVETRRIGKLNVYRTTEAGQRLVDAVAGLVGQPA